MGEKTEVLEDVLGKGFQNSFDTFIDCDRVDFDEIRNILKLYFN